MVGEGISGEDGDRVGVGVEVRTEVRVGTGVRGELRLGIGGSLVGVDSRRGRDRCRGRRGLEVGVVGSRGTRVGIEVK